MPRVYCPCGCAYDFAESMGECDGHEFRCKQCFTVLYAPLPNGIAPAPQFYVPATPPAHRRVWDALRWITYGCVFVLFAAVVTPAWILDGGTPGVALVLVSVISFAWAWMLGVGLFSFVRMVWRHVIPKIL